MKSLGSITVAFLAMSGMATQTHAATFTPSMTGPVDFGNVSVGSAQTIDFSILVAFASGETPAGGRRIVSRSGELSASFIDGDCLYGGRCDFQFSFTPQSVGLQSRVIDLLSIDTGGATLQDFDIELIGNGVAVSEVPLPASMPLLLVGFAGFAALRRQTKARQNG